jgi:hypothetical protein
LRGELKVEDVEVLGYPLGPGGFGDSDVAVLHVPAQDDQGSRFAVGVGDVLDRFVVAMPGGPSS